MKELGNPLTEKHCCLALTIISILNTYPLEAATNFFMTSLLYIQELKLTLTATTKNVIMDLSAWHCRNLAGVHLFSGDKLELPDVQHQKGGLQW